MKKTFALVILIVILFIGGCTNRNKEGLYNEEPDSRGDVEIDLVEIDSVRKGIDWNYLLGTWQAEYKDDYAKKKITATLEIITIDSEKAEISFKYEYYDYLPGMGVHEGNYTGILNRITEYRTSDCPGCIIKVDLEKVYIITVLDKNEIACVWRIRFEEDRASAVYGTHPEHVVELKKIK